MRPRAARDVYSVGTLVLSRERNRNYARTAFVDCSASGEGDEKHSLLQAENVWDLSGSCRDDLEVSGHSAILT
jgi:hypothetical protein